MLSKLCQYFKPISISLSPNTEKDDIRLALKLIFQPRRWKKELRENPFPVLELMEEEFKKYLGVKHIIPFNSGRSALLAILKNLNLNQGDEVLLQAFTCNAAVNPVLWTNPRQGPNKPRSKEILLRGKQKRLKPIYVDVDEKTFNIDPEDLRRKITSKSKAVMVQHTFGLPAEMDEILKICKKNNLILIEDCAHSLGAQYKNKKIGTFGKAAFFSFSRDKVISSVYGGVAVTNDDELGEKLKKFQKRIDYPPNSWIFQQLLHPVLINYLILPTYRIFGKYFLILLQRFQILSKAVHWKEKRGKKPPYFPKKLPNALAILALHQFKKLEKFNSHRKEIAKFYLKALKNTPFELPQIPNGRNHIFLRFTIKRPYAYQIIKKAWGKNLLVGDWYTTPVAPHDTNFKKVKYKLGSCPKAEKLSKITFNLPTNINISKDKAQKIVDFLKTLTSKL